MLFYLGELLKEFFGPARLLQSYTVLITLALYSSFFLVNKLLPKFYNILPQDRGREFTISAEAAKGKPTGSGIVFITIFAIMCILFVPMGLLQYGILLLTWLTMLTGFLDDHSVTSWGEYKKGLLDLVISLSAALLMYYCFKSTSPDGKITFWLPFVTHPIVVHPVVFVIICVILLWASINTTNCTDGVDGLSGTLVLIALITLGIIFYFILGHKDIAAYLLVPHLKDGAKWAVMTFALAGTLMGYLWHNAFPSSVLMGDAGSRALGFFIGVCVIITRNPLIFIATSTIMLFNGGTGLLKVALLRFFKIKIFENVRFPLHDHMRKNHGWSPTQVLVKFMIMQVLITVATIGIFFKLR
ncbi:MAG: phospho-N-acetylmuramoyl-pentapeptide-transferase [Treponema sp.]|nr:phospho-N-acetylmuramoyl-pentapeptide-transferase [Treponema sp.]MBQ5876771.1 phospho-N-acetylmuramoyl-pentapeptide-transferase [Treponema sp.]